MLRISSSWVLAKAWRLDAIKIQKWKYFLGSLGRLESQESGEEKHDLEAAELDAKHAENQAAVAESKALSGLDAEAKHLVDEIKKVCSS